MPGNIGRERIYIDKRSSRKRKSFPGSFSLVLLAVGVFGFRLPRLKRQGETRVEIEDLGAEYEFVFGLDLVGFGLLHAGLGVVVVEGRRAARSVFLGFVPEGDLCGIERFSAERYFNRAASAW